MSVLLTDEAVEVARERLSRFGPVTMEQVVDAFLHHHATEGREAVQRVVRDAILASDGGANNQAEAVVTALFGEASPCL